MNWKIPLYKICNDEADVKAVSRVIERGSAWAIGPEIEEFERIVSDYVGVKYASAFNSGTSALHALLLAAGVESGQEVICPSFSFIATSNSILFTGSKPVFADIEEKTYGMSIHSLMKKITINTRIIMPVHIGGIVCQDIAGIEEVARSRNVLLIEDACEGLGSVSFGKKAGSIGDAAVLSFCGNKIITTGEGGMVLTNSRELHAKVNLLRSHGRAESENYFLTTKSLDYIQLGYNWRMPSMIAALGISQMAKLETVIEKRRRIARTFTSEFSKLDCIQVPIEPSGFRHVYQMYTLRVKNGGRKKRDELRNFLSNKGIITKIYFEPIHLTRFYQTEILLDKHPHLDITEKVSQEVLTLPIYPTMTEEEVSYIIDSVVTFCKSTCGN
ncbi:MAG: DegT/DnrJ/EryC1/StrS family aminotransferase [Nitrososphaerales archaeon]